MRYQNVKNLFQDELTSFGNESFDTFYSLKYIRSLAIRKIFDGEATLWIDNVLTDKKETLNDIVNESFHDAYISLKMDEVLQFEHTPHPVEFKMYYSV